MANRRTSKPQYKYHPSASSVTLYSSDGSPVPEDILHALESFAERLAQENKLLTATNRA